MFNVGGGDDNHYTIVAQWKLDGRCDDRESNPGPPRFPVVMYQDSINNDSWSHNPGLGRVNDVLRVNLSGVALLELLKVFHIE